MRDQSSKYLIYVLIGVIVVIVVLGIIYYPRREVHVIRENGQQGGAPVQRSAEQPQQQKPTLVLFHSEKCGYCKMMAPEWEKLKASPMASKIDIVDFEYTTNPTEAQKHQIGSFPTIRFYPRGYSSPQQFVEYKGDRTADAIIAFLVNGPPPKQ